MHFWPVFPTVPVRQISGSRLEIVTACHNGKWSGSPSCFTIQRKIDEKCTCTEKNTPKHEGIDSEAGGKTNTEHTLTFTRDWVYIESMLHAKGWGGIRSPEEEEEDCERIFNDGPGSIDDLCLLINRIFYCSREIFPPKLVNGRSSV